MGSTVDTMASALLALLTGSAIAREDVGVRHQTKAGRLLREVCTPRKQAFRAGKPRTSVSIA
jgi:hypothetical protein